MVVANIVAAQFKAKFAISLARLLSLEPSDDPDTGPDVIVLAPEADALCHAFQLRTEASSGSATWPSTLRGAANSAAFRYASRSRCTCWRRGVERARRAHRARRPPTHGPVGGTVRRTGPEGGAAAVDPVAVGPAAACGPDSRPSHGAAVGRLLADPAPELRDRVGADAPAVRRQPVDRSQHQRERSALRQQHHRRTLRSREWPQGRGAKRGAEWSGIAAHGRAWRKNVRERRCQKALDLPCETRRCACTRNFTKWSRGESNPRAKTVGCKLLRVYPMICIQSGHALGRLASFLGTRCISSWLPGSPHQDQPVACVLAGHGPSQPGHAT